MQLNYCDDCWTGQACGLRQETGYMPSGWCTWCIWCEPRFILQSVYVPRHVTPGHVMNCFCLALARPFCTCRRLYIFPNGNNTRFLSVYLDCPECSNLPIAMCPTAYFHLVIVNQVYPERTWRSKEVHHLYNAKATDWGFNETLPLQDLYDMNAGFLKDDTAIIRVELKVRV